MRVAGRRPSAARSATTIDLATRLAERVEHVPRLDAVAGDHGRGRGARRRSPANTPRRSNTSRSPVVEQRVRPVDRGPQRLVALDRGAPAAGEEPEPLVEQRGDLGRAHRRRPGPRRARSRAGCRRGGGRSRRPPPRSRASSAKSGRAAARPLDEQLHRVGRSMAAASTDSARRASQRAQRPHLLARRPRGPRGSVARIADARGSRAAIRSARSRRGVEQVLAVVEHERAAAWPAGTRRCSPRATRPGAACTPSVAATTWTSASGSSAAASSHNHAPSGKRGSTSAATWSARRVLPTPPTPVRVTRRDSSSAFGDRGELVVAADERRRAATGRLPGNASSDRSGGKSRGEAGCDDLEDALGAGEVAEAVLAEVDQRRRRRQVVADELLGRVRHDDLAAVRAAETRAARFTAVP